MMKTRTWRTILLTLVLLLAVSGCGQTAIQQPVTTPAATAESTEPSPDNAAAEGDEQVSEPEPVATDESDVAVEKPFIRVAALAGPTGMGMVRLMKDHEEENASHDYEFTVTASPDALVGKILNGEVDVAAVPTNLAMVLHNRTEGEVLLAAVNTLGVLYVLESGDTVHSMSDLQGRTLAASGKGAMPDFVIQFLLAKNGLSINEDVMVDFTLEHADLAAAAAAGDAPLVLLPQPHVTTAMMRNPDLRIALDITEEWTTVSEANGTLAMGVLIVQKAYAEAEPEALNAFLDAYRASVDYVNTHVDEAAELIAEFGILPNAAVAKNAIPLSNIVYMDASEAKPMLQELYEVLFSFEPKSVGGKLADESFYYER